MVNAAGRERLTLSDRGFLCYVGYVMVALPSRRMESTRAMMLSSVSPS